MKPYIANIVNGLSLIIFSGWGYLSSATPSPTALIPAGVGLVLLLITNGVKKEEKIQAHIAVTLTFLILLALIMPLLATFKRDDAAASVRVALMMLTSLIAMISFIRSFIAARKARQSKA